MPDYKELFDLLSDCSDTEQSALNIRSAKLVDSVEILDKYGIEYHKEQEGIHIELSGQGFEIYKDKRSALEYLEGRRAFTKDILILEQSVYGNQKVETVYFKDSAETSTSCIFENIIYLNKFRELFIEWDICSFSNELDKTLIFLSPDQGRVDIKYAANWAPEFYESNHDLKQHFQTIKDKVQEKDFKNIFKESYIKTAIDIHDCEKRFTGTLITINAIMENAERNYELYQNKFSFAEFEKGLYEEKEKFIKEHQSSLHEFLSQTSYMPIQFGTYIYLVNRFSDSASMLIVVAVVILAWSMFSCMTVYRILDNIKDLKNNSKDLVSSIKTRSGISKDEFQEIDKVIRKIPKSICLLWSYLALVVIFSLCMLVFCISFIMNCQY